MASPRARALLGRAREREIIDRLLANVRTGQSGVLVIRGDAGIGKTALLQYAAQEAPDFRIADIAGVESEMEFPFAGAHQLCAPMFKRLDALPEPERNALSVPLGLRSCTAPDPFLVRLAVLARPPAG